MKRSITLLLTVCCCGLNTSCSTTGGQQFMQGLASVGAGVGGALIARANGANTTQALAIGAGAMAITYIALNVIAERNAEERERQAALQRARSSNSKSDYVYVAQKSSGGKTELIGVNKRSGKISTKVNTVASTSIPSTKKVTINSQQGEVIY